jgi:cystathionine beta-lyase
MARVDVSPYPDPREQTGLDAIDLAELHRRHSAKWRNFPADVLPTFVAEMDYPLAPPIRRALHAAVEAGDLGYTADRSDRRLPGAFARWAEASGWAVPAEDVLVLPDVMRGIELALRVGTEPGDGVVVNTPIYPPFLSAVRESGRDLVDSRLVRTATGRYELDLDDLTARFAAGARAYLLCNPHNPSGRVLAADELRAVLRLAAEHDVLVVADEIHSPLVLPGARHTVAATLPEAAGVRLLTVTSASKAWNVPGLRCALAVPNGPGLRDALRALPWRATSGASILGVAANVAAYTEGQPWLAAVLAHLDRNRRLLADLLRERLPEVGYAVPEATYLGWLDCRPLGLADPAATFLAGGRVAVGDGTAFGPPGTGFVRVSFATSAAILTEIVDRMAAALPR